MLKYRLKQLKKEKYFLLRTAEKYSIKKEDYTFPDFLIIGAQKAGTTWLHSYLQTKDEIYFPYLESRHDPSEVRFFEYLDKPLRWYSDLYENHVDKIKGDKTPGYYYLHRKSIRMIKDLMPDVKNIMMLRNPAERAWSQAVMNLRMFHNMSFNDNKAAYLDFLYTNIHRGLYSFYLKNWREFFPGDQLQIYLFDDLKKNPVKLIENIEGYLGLQKSIKEEPGHSLNKKVNANPIEPMPDEVKRMLKKLYKDEIIKINRDFNLNVLHWNDI